MRNVLLTSLSLYRESWVSGKFKYPTYSPAEELTTWQRFEAFVASEPQCFERSCPTGHVTGSALITNAAMDKVLLTLHAKLGKWLQLGGHSDGDAWTHRVAWREGCEESGLEELKFADWSPEDDIKAIPRPFDLDIHLIPARHKESAHWHFDARYLLIADDRLPLAITDESHQLRWFTLEEAEKVTQERSMLRQFEKLRFLRSNTAISVSAFSVTQEPSV